MGRGSSFLLGDYGTFYGEFHLSQSIFVHTFVNGDAVHSLLAAF